MDFSILIILGGFIPLGITAFFVSKNKLEFLYSNSHKLHSLPIQYGYLNALITLSPLFVLVSIGAILSIMQIHISWQILFLTSFVLSFIAFGLGIKFISPQTKARDILENIIKYIFIACATISIITTFAILISIVVESIKFFQLQDFWYFLTGTQWSPEDAFLESVGRAEGAFSSTAKFGSVPLFAGTFMITFIAIGIAVPFGILSAIYLAEYASPKVRGILKPALEILAGIPTIVYGFFAAITIAPAFVDFFSYFGFEVSYNNALASGVIMGVMITPIIMSLSEDAIRSVPKSLRLAAAGLGMLKAETIKYIILPTALPGIIAAVILGVSRAIGETMIVVMAAGLRPNITINPLEDMTTVTVRIVDALTGDHEFNGAQTLSVFALGLVLFVFTVLLNTASLYIMRHFNKKYRLN